MGLNGGIKMVKNVNSLPSPSLIQRPRVDFRSADFDAINWTKGLDVIIESAIRCPCKSKDNDHLSNCQNCLGVGWVFINSTRDRAILASINSETKYKDWSELKRGTVQVTLQNRSYLSYMDRITVEDSQVMQSEVLNPIVFNDNYFAYTIYDIDAIVEVFRFIAPDQALQLLEQNTHYTVSGNKILITVTNFTNLSALMASVIHENGQLATVTSNESLYEFDSSSTEDDNGDTVIKPGDIDNVNPGRWLKVENYTISARYYHKLQYHVLDTPRTVRNSYKKNNLGREELQLLPIHGVARLSHYVVDALNFSGDNIFNNSYNVE